MMFVICDDELDYLDTIERLIVTNISIDNFQISKFSSGKDLLSFSKINQIDILYIDIELTDGNGVEIAKTIKQNQPNCIIFFVTWHNTYITEIFRVGTFQFLKKPINMIDFKIDLERAINLYKENHKNITILANRSQKELPISKIVYIEVYMKKITIHLVDNNIIHYGNLKYYEEKLLNYDFGKPHDSFLVNLKYIEEVHANDIIISNELIPMGRKYKKDFLHKYNLFRLHTSI